MFFNKRKNLNYNNPNNLVKAPNMQAFYKAISYNYDNFTNAERYLKDIKKYDISDEDIIKIYNDKNNNHPVVKNNLLINETCKSYGFEEFFYGIKTLKKMMNDNLFDYEIKEILRNQINFYEEIEKFSSSYIKINLDDKPIKTIYNINDNIDIYTDGEILSDEKGLGRTIKVREPSFIIKAYVDDIYRCRDDITIYGYNQNRDKLPTFKEMNNKKQYKR